MKSLDQILMNTPFGEISPDSDGSPIGLARIEPEKSYSEIGGLLQDFINNSNEVAWDKIRKKIDYTFENLDLALDAF